MKLYISFANESLVLFPVRKLSNYTFLSIKQFELLANLKVFSTVHNSRNLVSLKTNGLDLEFI